MNIDERVVSLIQINSLSFHCIEINASKDKALRKIEKMQKRTDFLILNLSFASHSTYIISSLAHTIQDIKNITRSHRIYNNDEVYKWVCFLITSRNELY